MKKTTFFIAAIATLLCTNCSNDEPEVNLPKQPVSSNPYRVSLNDAVDAALPLLNQLDGLRTRSNRQISDIEYVVQDLRTRSNSEPYALDTTIYIVNFKDDNGFAILGADKRVPAILGLSNTGNIDLNDTTENEAFAQCLGNIKCTASYGPGLGLKDSVPNIGNIGIIPDKQYINLKNKISPMITKAVSKWGQKGDFSKYCNPYNVFPYRYTVGCGPLAAAMITTYYKWPNKIDDLVLNWNIINTWELDPSSIMIQEIPDIIPQYLAKVQKKLGATNGPGGNTALTSNDFIKNFPKLGYAQVGTPKDFSDNAAYQALMSKSPLMMVGFNQDKTDGHMWVVDGSLLYSECYGGDLNTYKEYYLFHCVWGYDGLNNGYFLFNNSSKSMNMLDPKEFEEYEGSGSPSISKTYYDIKFWSNFTPIK